MRPRHEDGPEIVRTVTRAQRPPCARWRLVTSESARLLRLLTTNVWGGRCMEAAPDSSLRVPGQDGGQGGPALGPTDGLSLRSAERRMELLHDVVSIRSDRSRRRPRSVHTAPKKTLWRRFKDAFRTVIAFVFSNVGICVLVLVYLILGGLKLYRR